MTSHSSKSMESDMKSIKSLLKQISKDIQSISSKQLENEAKTNKLTKAKDEKSQISKKLHSHAYTQVYDSFREESLGINEPPPRRARKERQEDLKEGKVELPHFYGKEDVETYLYWEMRVEQLFAYNHVSEDVKTDGGNHAFAAGERGSLAYRAGENARGPGRLSGQE